MFDAIYFTYDGLHSSTYGLELVDFDESSHTDITVLTPVLNTVKPKGLPRFFHNGVTYEEVTQHQYNIISRTPIGEELKREIMRWLVGRDSFKKFEIHQDGFDGYYYQCVFTAINIIYINGMCHGFSVTGNFDSPYQYGSPTSITITGNGTEQTITLLNKSDILDDYTYPIVEFTPTSVIGSGTNAIDISIVNTTDDDNRAFMFSGLALNDKITIDNEIKIIKSTTKSEKLSKFNKNWLRLKHGQNILVIKIIGTVTITCPNYALIGF